MVTFVVRLPGDVPVKPGSGANEAYRRYHMQALKCTLSGFARVYSSVALCTDWSKTTAFSSVGVLGGKLLFAYVNRASASSTVLVSTGATFQDWDNDRILDMVALAITSSDPLLYVNYDETAATDTIHVPVETSSLTANADRSRMTITDDLVTTSKYYTVSDSAESSLETTNPLTQDEMIRAIN